MIQTKQVKKISLCIYYTPKVDRFKKCVSYKTAEDNSDKKTIC